MDLELAKRFSDVLANMCEATECDDTSKDDDEIVTLREVSSECLKIINQWMQLCDANLTEPKVDGDEPESGEPMVSEGSGEEDTRFEASENGKRPSEESSQKKVKKTKDENLWMMEFFDGYTEHDIAFLCELLMAANFLVIETMIDAISEKISSFIEGKEPEQIRKIFALENDFEPGEDQRLMRLDVWNETP